MRAPSSSFLQFAALSATLVLLQVFIFAPSHNGTSRGGGATLRSFDSKSGSLNDLLEMAYEGVLPDVIGGRDGKLEKFGGSEANLLELSSKLRLCTPRAAPFVAGTLYRGSSMAQVTVFEAEIAHGSAASRSKREASPLLQFLAFVEDDASMESSKTGWGGATQSRLLQKTHSALTCNFWPGIGRELQNSQPAAFSSTASLLAIKDQYTIIKCPLPDPPHPLLLAQRFQVELSLHPSRSSLLHLPLLPICRCSSKEASPLVRSMRSVHPQYTTPNSSSSSPPPSTPPTVTSPPPSSSSKAMSLAICIRPYSPHPDFLDQDGVFTHSPSRFSEFINYHLLLGVNQIYVYDRHGDELLPFLQPYMSHGVVSHVAFPHWSEVFYRKEKFKDSAHPHLFPNIYDQILHFEHCMMQGRRNGDTWQFMIDTDEFLWTPMSVPFGLPAVMRGIEEEHDSKFSDFHDRSTAPALAVVNLRSFLLLGSQESDRPVLKAVTARCRRHTQYHRYEGMFDKNKVAVKPALMWEHVVWIHDVRDVGAHKQASSEALRIHHFFSTPFAELNASKESPPNCHEKDKPEKLTPQDTVEDSSLKWAVKALERCLDIFTCLKMYSH